MAQLALQRSARAFIDAPDAPERRERRCAAIGHTVRTLPGTKVAQPCVALQASAAALHCAAGVCNMFIACSMSLDVRVAAGGPRANKHPHRRGSPARSLEYLLC